MTVLLVAIPARAELPPPEPTPEVPADASKEEKAEARMVAVARAGETARGADAALSRIIDRPHTIAELQAGVVALPTAPISPGQRGGDTPFVGKIGRGDATLQVGLHILYRWNRLFAVGAGAFFAPSPTSDSEYGGLTGVKRSHARSYLFMGTEARFIPLHYKYVEAWVGMTVGGVVIADRFTNESAPAVPTILGTSEVTVRSEGLAIGGQVGGSYYLSENWIAGVNLRGLAWFLPESPRCTAIGDCATLTGAVAAIEFGLTIGYRLAL
ncbi:MAG: hypothetical protein FWD73_01965 [Polyangiaceae bacterium]|nr:hypothetical protein [Polyangiaceae bacterium]